MKYSIKQQFATIFIGVMAGTIVLCWFINNTFLESFYINHKTTAIHSAYDSLNGAAVTGDIMRKEFDVELRKICDMYNISVIVIDAQSNTVKSSSRDTDMLINRLYDNLFVQKKDRKYLEETTQYTVAMQEDRATGTEYLEMWGVLDNGNLFSAAFAVGEYSGECKDCQPLFCLYRSCGNGTERLADSLCYHKAYEADYAA